MKGLSNYVLIHKIVEEIMKEVSCFAVSNHKWSDRLQKCDECYENNGVCIQTCRDTMEGGCSSFNTGKSHGKKNTSLCKFILRKQLLATEGV